MARHAKHDPFTAEYSDGFDAAGLAASLGAAFDADDLIDLDVTEDLADRLTFDHGFTFDPYARACLNVGDVDGYAIALPDTEREVGTAGSGVLSDTLALALAETLIGYGADLRDGEIFIGGWYSADRQEFMIELSELHHVDRATALALAAERGQEAVIDMGTGEEIFLASTERVLAGEALIAGLFSPVADFPAE